MPKLPNTHTAGLTSRKRLQKGTKLFFLLAFVSFLYACDAPPDPSETSPQAIQTIAEIDDTQGKPETRTPATIAMAERLQSLIGTLDPVIAVSKTFESRFVELRKNIQSAPDAVSRASARVTLAETYLNTGRSMAAVIEAEAAQKELAKSEQASSANLSRRLQEIVAISYLRLGEQQNCIDDHNVESCLLPIAGDGVHRQRLGSEQAVTALLEQLKENPENLRARWLLNLAHMTLGQYPDQVPERWLIPPAAFDSDYPLPRFVDMAADAGVDMLSLAGGVVLDDFDNDGNLDLMVSDWAPEGQLRFFRGIGNGKFQEETHRAGLTGEVGGLNLIQADYDNDGLLDVLILRGAWMGANGRHPNSLLRNLGDGRFDDVTERAGLLSSLPTQTATWADYDLDGWVDLFIGNESHSNNHFPSEFYRNNGDGTFSEIASQLGLDLVAFIKGASFGDYDNDGDPDLVVSRLFKNNLLLRNDVDQNGVRRFHDASREARIKGPKRSFPTFFWDYNNDGLEDILIAPLEHFTPNKSGLNLVVSDYLGISHYANRIALYRNKGDGSFEDVADKVGLSDTLLAMGTNFGDLDKDGWLDVYFGTGDVMLITLVPNRMYRNAAGKVFQDVTTAGGFGHIQKGHGIAFGDVDNDGDEDIYASMGGAVSGDLYQNALFKNPGNDNHWLTLRLRGVKANRAAIGARLKLSLATPNGPRTIYRTISSGGSFGASSLQAEIGLGDATSITQLEIHWPGGEKQILDDLPINRILQITEGQAAITLKP